MNDRRILETTSLVLRIGLALVFAYAGYRILAAPSDWLGFVPEWIPQRERGLMAHGVLDAVVALWLLSGWQKLLSAGLALVSLLAIVIANAGAIDIVFRDVGLAFMALALVILARHERTRR